MVKLIQSLHILPRWIILLIDLGILSFSLILAYFVRFDFQFERFLATNVAQGLPIFLVCNLIAIFLTQSYSGIIRHTGLQDGYRIAYTTTLGVVFTLIINYIYLNYFGIVLIPLGVVTMAYLNALIFLIGYRILVKYIFSYYKHAVHRKENVVIFGAGKTGQLTKQIFDSDHSVSGRPVAFIEDNPKIVGKVINGIRIFSARNLDSLIKELKISELIIATPNLSLQRKNEIVDFCLKKNIKVRSIPPGDQWIRGELSFNQIKDIKIEDLLGRESIKLDSLNIIKEIKGKSVFISGSAGSIGAELVRQVLSYHPTSLTLFDQAESATFELLNEVSSLMGNTQVKPYIGDITDQQRLEEVLGKVKPDIIFHAAAYKHVPLMEDNPLEAVKCNVFGTKNLADLAVKYEVGKFVMISTDKAVNPTSIMGATKRIAEMYVQSLYHHLTDNNQGKKRTLFITTRFGNVLGSNGSVIPLFKKQIEKRLPITVTHPKITRYFMTISEACQLVLEAGSMGRGGEIYIFDMGKSIKIVDLAKKMVQLSGLELNRDIELKFTGLRPGEKLYEELLNNKESTIPTHHPKIMIANVQKEENGLIQDYFEQLQQALDDNNEKPLVELMKSLVPEYVSNASRFQKLDLKKRDAVPSSSQNVEEQLP